MVRLVIWDIIVPIMTSQVTVMNGSNSALWLTIEWKSEPIIVGKTSYRTLQKASVPACIISMHTTGRFNEITPSITLIQIQ